MDSQATSPAPQPALGPTSVLPAKASPGKPTGWRKWLYRLLALTLVPALVFGLLELGLRTCNYGYDPAFFIDHPTAQDQRFLIDNPEFWRRFFSPGLGREAYPVLLAKSKPDDSYRIFVLGES